MPARRNTLDRVIRTFPGRHPEHKMVCPRQRNTVLIALLSVVSLYMVLNSSPFEAMVSKRQVPAKEVYPSVPVSMGTEEMPEMLARGLEEYLGPDESMETEADSRHSLVEAATEAARQDQAAIEEYLAHERSIANEADSRQSLVEAAAEAALRTPQDQGLAASDEEDDAPNPSIKETKQGIQDKSLNADQPTSLVDKTFQEPPNTLPCNMDWHFHSHQEIHTQKSTPGKPKNKPLLVLFTSFKNSGDRNMTHTNTIINWGRLRPDVAPVAFNDSTDPYLLKLAKQHGWTILPLHDKASHEAPRVEYMYEAARKTFPDSLFVGFANGDILFDDGLLDTVRFVGSLVPSLNRTMIIGARYNVDLKGESVTTSEDIRRLIREERTPEIVPICIDYFIIARNQFPWHQFPDNLVIGRPAYDNYFVGLARHDNMTVVDSSCTIGALHQIGKDGTKSGSHNIDSDFNINILKGFNKGTGKINKAAYFTLPGEENTGLALHKHDKEKYPTKKEDFNNLTQ